MQDTTPQIQTFLVAIDQAASIRQGIACPHSTAKIDLDLATLTPELREWIAARHAKGELRRHPDNSGVLLASCPRAECLLRAIAKAIAEDDAKAAKRASENALAHTDWQAKVKLHNNEPLRMVHVVNVGNYPDSWSSIDDAIAKGQWRGEGCRLSLPQRPGYLDTHTWTERVSDEAQAEARRAMQAITDGINAKLDAQDQARQTEQRARLEPHLTEIERGKQARGLLYFSAVEVRLDNETRAAARAALGDDYELHGSHRFSAAASATDEQYELLLAVEQALQLLPLGAGLDAWLNTWGEVCLTLTTPDGRQIEDRVSRVSKDDAED